MTDAILSLHYQAMLRSQSALALWEICRRYATNPSHLTASEPVLYWCNYLSGRPVDELDPPEYKYFKRDTILPAIAEVNAVTDIEVELIEHKMGRRVANLQFRVHLKNQQSLPFQGPPLVDSKVIERIVALGFSAADAGDISVSHEEAFLIATLELVEARLRAHDAPPVHAPMAFFKTALRERYASNKKVAAKAVALENKAQSRPIGTKRVTATEAFNASRCEDALNYFREVDDDARQEYAARFIESAPRAISETVRKSGLETKMARVAFGNWLAEDLWGAAKPEDIIAFVDKRGLE